MVGNSGKPAKPASAKKFEKAKQPRDTIEPLPNFTNQQATSSKLPKLPTESAPNLPIGPSRSTVPLPDRIEKLPALAQKNNSVMDTNADSILKNLTKKDEGENKDGAGSEMVLPKKKIRITVRATVKDSKVQAETQENNLHTRLAKLRDEMVKKKESLLKKSPSEILPNIHKPGWLLQRTNTINTHMPLPQRWSRVPVGMLPVLRETVKKKEAQFIREKEKCKLASNIHLFRELDSRAAAYTNPIMHQFLAASSAYSCATPDNRIRLYVEKLENIQQKDEKLRELDQRVSKIRSTLSQNSHNHHGHQSSPLSIPRKTSEQNTSAQHKFSPSGPRQLPALNVR